VSRLNGNLTWKCPVSGLCRNFPEFAGISRKEARTIGHKSHESQSPPPLWKSLVAEVFGTFALTFVAAGGEVVGKLSHGEVGHAEKAVAPGLLVMAMIYALGPASGAHLNPGATLTFALRRCFPLARLPLYWVAQVGGAVLAALFLRQVLGGAGEIGTSLSRVGEDRAFWMEFALSALLYTVILGVAQRYSLVGPTAAVAVGGTVALCGLFASPISGASMNPARWLGSAIVSGRLENAWIYVVAPLLATLVALVISTCVKVQEDGKEKEAAQGESEGAKTSGDKRAA